MAVHTGGGAGGDRVCLPVDGLFSTARSGRRASCLDCPGNGRAGRLADAALFGEPFFDKPILYFWCQALSLRLFGMNEAAVRLPGLMFGLLGAITTGLIGWRMFGRTAGWVAGIFYGTMILPVALAQAASHDVAAYPLHKSGHTFFMGIGAGRIKVGRGGLRRGNRFFAGLDHTYQGPDRRGPGRNGLRHLCACYPAVECGEFVFADWRRLQLQRLWPCPGLLPWKSNIPDFCIIFSSSAIF